MWTSQRSSGLRGCATALSLPSAILHLVRRGSSWSLAPFGEYREQDHALFERWRTSSPAGNPEELAQPQQRLPQSQPRPTTTTTTVDAAITHSNPTTTTATNSWPQPRPMLTSMMTATTP